MFFGKKAEKTHLYYFLILILDQQDSSLPTQMVTPPLTLWHSSSLCKNPGSKNACVVMEKIEYFRKPL